jgi:transcriptional regulator with XRE-family HTH domain
MRKWLRELRENKGFSQKTLAQSVGMSQPFYTNIEKGNRRPSPETAKKIAEVLDFDWTMFFEDIPQS